MTPRLKGQVALVTGASRGIGKSVALELAREGANLLLTSTQAAGWKSTVAEVEKLGGQATGFTCDIRQPAQVDALVAYATETWGRVDCLVNNAGTVQWSLAQDTSDEDFERVLAVNLKGPFFLIRRLLPGMLKRGSGRIINVSSISGTLGTPKLSAYCASKWGLSGLTKALAEELKGTGVLVFGVLPGSVDTDMLKGSPFKPAMQPEEVAQTVRYLCTEAPPAMIGSLVEIYG